MAMEKEKRKYLLCFHDLSIDNTSKVLPILNKLKSIIGNPFPVLVIPSTKNFSKEQVSEFSSILQNLQNDGFELLIHGFNHQADKNLTRDLYGKIALSLTNNEAEFAGLQEKDSALLLQNAFNCWDSFNLKQPIGFVAPTWHGNRFLKKQVLANDLIFEERFFLRKNNCKKIFSPVISFAGMPKFSFPLLFLAGKTLNLFSPGIPRLALHPSDFPFLENKIFKLVETINKNFTFSFYRDLF